MTKRQDGRERAYTSPPCFAHEIAPDYFDPLAVDPQQAANVARWRRGERRRLRAERLGISGAERREVAAALARALDALVAERLGSITGRVISGYWPIKGEPDLRPWLAAMNRAGAVTALPVVETKAAPLVFRRWRPETRMVRGDWNILVPPPEASAVTPEVALAPLVGWDSAGYRLGYGGGFSTGRSRRCLGDRSRSASACSRRTSTRSSRSPTTSRSTPSSPRRGCSPCGRQGNARVTPRAGGTEWP